MRRGSIPVFGVALLLVGGLLLAGGGWYYQSTADECSPYYLEVSGDTTGYETEPLVAFENLTVAQQRVFREALSADRSLYPTDDAHFEEPRRVRYENETYAVATVAGDGCLRAANDTLRVLPMGLGLVVALTGTAVIYTEFRRRLAD